MNGRDIVDYKVMVGKCERFNFNISTSGEDIVLEPNKSDAPLNLLAFPDVKGVLEFLDGYEFGLDHGKTNIP